ncbi:filamin-A-interacting protein 1-like [Scleropages formosus]|uniref:Filamin A interacting protein 1 n=1 Tax=Scleropages formosus TaxID=113540 RepID=A0A8C9T3Y1_SCLFO|nr:filamin-A-interacting protein 1-like [Scleropages formosus]
MRSRSNTDDTSANRLLNAPHPTSDLSEDEGGKVKGSQDPQQQDAVEMSVSELVKTHQKSAKNFAHKHVLVDLSKDNLVRLLGIMEGEVQAREDVIRIMSQRQTPPEVLEAHYASAGHLKALQALRRDGLVTGSQSTVDHVYEKPMAELDRLEDKHRETYRRMLGQLLLAEKWHRRTALELDSEKRKHADYMAKSDDFTNLLEQERERLKRLLEQEKAYQVRKDKEHSRRLEKLREELVKLKSFTLMLVDERQLHIEQVDQQTEKVQNLTQKLQEKEQKMTDLKAKVKEDGQKVAKLEAELEHKATRFTQEHEETSAKLANQESQNRQLRLKLAGLTHKIEELEESNKALQKSEEELQELRDKISKGECGNSSLMAELENLRKRVMEMEGKDEEITKTESQCRELRKKLLDEENRSKELKLEVEKLQKRMVELEKLEGAFNVSKMECTQLHGILEREKNQTKELAGELEVVKNHVKELESSESRLEKVEVSLKDDLTKLKSFTVLMVEERKNMAERIRQEEKKSYDLNKMFKTEQAKVMEVTEKLIEESKKLLKLKSEMEAKVTFLTRERDELKTKLTSEEEKCEDLSSKLSSMKHKMEGIEEAERKAMQSRARKDVDGCSDGISQSDNRVKELTLEIERLKHRLKQLEVVEGDLMKTEDEYDLLEKKFRTEQDKANVLSQQLEEMRNQLARNKAIEKGEAVSQESELRQRCKMEEAKTRDLQADVQALKEKIHELMNKEDQLSQLQVEYSVLQQRFMEEEKKRTTISQDVLHLTKELEMTKRYSRALRPSMNGRRMVDVPVTSTGVQTDAVNDEPPEEDTPAVFIRKSVQEENHIMSNLRQKGLKKTAERPAVLERYPPAAGEIGMRKSWIPWMKKKDGFSQNSPEKPMQPNEEPPHSELTVSQKQGQPLHIRLTPDHENSTATLQISGSSPKDFFSSTTVIPTLGLQKPRITIIPTPNTVSQNHKCSGGLERAKSPVSITTISRAKSPEGRRNMLSDRPTSPVSISTVSTSAVPDLSGSPELQEMTVGRAVFKVTPEKQTVPTAIRKYNSNTNIITTEDNKIHIHLGPQFKRASESSGPTITVRPVAVTTENKEIATGTVLRSPRHSSTAKSTGSKVMSSIMITPITSAPSRPTQSTDGLSPRAAPTRIPMSKGMKNGKLVLETPSVPTVTKPEVRAESQSMKIELKRCAVGNPATPAGGKG